MPHHGQKTVEEASAAGSEAIKGAVVGAAKVCIRLTYPHPHLSIDFFHYCCVLLISPTMADNDHCDSGD